MDDETKLKQNLNTFISSFDVLNDDNLSKERVMDKIKGIKNELEEGCLELDIEQTRAWNLISFFYFIVGDKENAISYNKLVTEKDVDNIIASSNRAWFHYEDKEFYECNVICQKLETGQSNNLQVIKAKAEIAYTYSRLGFHQYKNAVSKFRKVLQECTDSVDMPMEYVCIWKYGLALTLRRQLNVNNWYSSTDIDITKEKVRELLLLNHEISLIPSEAVCRYRAKAYVEMGLLVDSIKQTNGFISIKDVDILKEINSDLKLQSSEYYVQKAHGTCPDDVFVLERSGKYYRYKINIDKSIELLSKAISLRETSFGHHHLALSLKRKAEMSKRKNTYPKREPNEATKQNWYRTNMNPIQFRENDIETDEDPNTSAKQYYQTIENKIVPTKQDCRVNIRPSSAIGAFGHTDTESTESLIKSFSDVNVEVKQIVRNETVNVPTTEDETSNSKFKMNPHADEFIPRNINKDLGTQPTTKVNIEHMYNLPNHDTRRDIGMRRQGRGKDKFNWNRNMRGSNRGRGEQFYRGTHKDHRPMSTDSYLRETTPVRFNQNSMKTSHKPSYLRMINSPRNIKYFFNNSESKQIFYHLDKALGLTKFNFAALKDKGLMFRCTNQPQEALAAFRQLMKEKCSLMQLSNAYEQAAFCLFDLDSSASDQEEKAKNKYNVKIYLNKSIELSCCIVSSIPALKDCWSSVPTLKSLLLGQARTKHTLTELSQLNEKLGNYPEAIGFLKEVMELENELQDEGEKAAILMRIIGNCVKDNQYDEAVLTFGLIMCLPNGIKLIDPDMFYRVHIAGGLKSLDKGETEMCRLRLKHAMDLGKRLITTRNDENKDVCDDEEVNEDFDIFILCDECIDEFGRKVKSDLEKTGLKVTINSDAVIYGHTEMVGTINVMKRSSHYVVAVRGENEADQITPFIERYFLYLIEIQKEQAHKNIVVVTDQSSSKVSTLLKLQPYIAMSNNDALNQNQLLWLNDLLLMLATYFRHWDTVTIDNVMNDIQRNKMLSRIVKVRDIICDIYVFNTKQLGFWQ